MNRIRVTTAARRFGVKPSVITAAKTNHRISDAGHGFCYEEEVAALLPKMRLAKALKSLASRANSKEAVERNVEREISITFAEAATLYETTVDQVVRWKHAGRLEGPHGRVWKGQRKPGRIRHEFGPPTGKGASYRVDHSAPNIDREP